MRGLYRVAIIVLVVSTLASFGAAPRARADSCPAGTVFSGQWTETTPDTDIVHIQCQEVAKPVSPPPAGPCADVEHRAAQQLAQIEQQARLRETNGEFLRDWTKMGEQGRKKLVWDSADALVGSLAASIETEAEDYDKLKEEAETLKKTNFRTRLDAIEKKMKKLSTLAGVHTALDGYGKGRTTWETLQGAMQNGFKLGAENSDDVNALLNQDPDIREALTGDPGEGSLADQYRELAKLTLDEAADVAHKYHFYDGIVGPTVRITKFVFDAAYDDLQISLSADRVDQADANAGKLAVAAGLAESSYKNTVDELRTCRAANP